MLVELTSNTDIAPLLVQRRVDLCVSLSHARLQQKHDAIKMRSRRTKVFLIFIDLFVVFVDNFCGCVLSERLGVVLHHGHAGK